VAPPIMTFDGRGKHLRTDLDGEQHRPERDEKPDPDGAVRPRNPVSGSSASLNRRDKASERAVRLSGHI
jgi:hypothetical protein